MKGKRILIIDDQPIVLTAIARFLEQRGYEVKTATNGEEGVREAVELAPDLIITDVLMPVMDGWDFIRTLRATPDFTLTPVIILTDDDTAEARMQGFQLGADDFVGKGVIIEELNIRITRALERSAAIQRALTGEPAAAPQPSLHAIERHPLAPAVTPEVEPAPKVKPDRGSGLQLPPLAEAITKGQTKKGQPPPVPGGSSPGSAQPGMRGTLEQIGLASVLTLLSSGEKSGILTLSDPVPDYVGRVFMRNGCILKIRIDGEADLGPIEAFTEMMKWTQAAFSFSVQDVTSQDELQMTVEHLLMEASRVIDEGLP